MTDVMQYDVVVVGAGPAGLACAIRLKQLAPERSVCVLEKGATVGAHSLSGAVIEPGPLDALAPEWRQAPLGVCVPARRDQFRLLTRRGSIALPTWPWLRNHGNFIVSLGPAHPVAGEQGRRARRGRVRRLRGGRAAHRRAWRGGGRAHR